MSSDSELNILFITENFPPEVNAPATRGYEHCLEWVKQGARVVVLTCVPNFPQGKIYQGYKNKLYQTEFVEGIQVVRVWSYITANEGFVRRCFDYMSFAISSGIFGLLHKTDLILTTSPQFFVNFTGFSLAKLKRKPWIFELRDLWPESIKALGAIKNDRLISVLEKAELFFYRSASKVVAVSPAFKKNLVERGINEDKISVIPNGANLTLFSRDQTDGELKKRLSLENKFIVSYIGTHGMAHNLTFIVRCISQIKDQGIHFLFIGDGAEKQRILQVSRDLRLENATFLDPIPKNAVPEYLSISDVSLVPLKKAETFKTVIPSKIFESSAMRVPLLLGVDGQAREIVEDFKAGLYFEPENCRSFIQAVYKFIEDKQMYSCFQHGCKQLAEFYDRKRLALEMLSIMQQVKTVN